MAAIFAKMREYHNFLFYELSDERGRYDFPSIGVLCTVLPLYLYFSTSLGPRLMKNRQPFKLKTPIYYYNLFQIFISAYIFYLGSMGGWLNGYSLTCQPVDYTDNPRVRYMMRAVWWYNTVKLIDLMDTVFFVLRKKDRQISFLHLFHHFMMPIASFVAQKYYPNGHALFLGWINCFVHVVMYTYYLIAGLGPKYEKYLWWKKHVTTLQLVQFGMIFIHNLVASLQPNCNYPKWITVSLTLFSLQFVYMFGSFYYENYVKTRKTPTRTSIPEKNGKSKVQ